MIEPRDSGRHLQTLRPWLVLLGLLCSCKPGDHSRTTDLVGLFGGSAAGRGQASMPPATRTAAQAPANAAAGATAPTRTRTQPSAGAAQLPRADSGGASGAVLSVGGAGTRGSPEDAGAAGGVAISMPSTEVATSSCEPGFVPLAGTCACDLAGTFALHARLAVTLAAMELVEALTDAIDLRAIARQQTLPDGQTQLLLSACGLSTPDICVAARQPILPSPEAYAQYIPIEAWDGPDSPPAEATWSWLDASAVELSTTPVPLLFGVALLDPLGAWPASRTEIEGGAGFTGSAVNGAGWLDSDGDGKPGLTVRVVAPGGLTAQPTSGPPRSYGAASEACPRGNPQAARSPYAFLPVPQGLGIRRLSALYSGQRLIIELRGALDTCDRISGVLTGPAGATPALEGVIGGCATVSNGAESDCSEALLESAAAASGGGGPMALSITDGRFALVRVPDEITCAEVRSLNLY